MANILNVLITSALISFGNESMIKWLVYNLPENKKQNIPLMKFALDLYDTIPTNFHIKSDLNGDVIQAIRENLQNVNEVNDFIHIYAKIGYFGTILIDTIPTIQYWFPNIDSSTLKMHSLLSQWYGLFAGILIYGSDSNCTIDYILRNALYNGFLHYSLYLLPTPHPKDEPKCISNFILYYSCDIFVDVAYKIIKTSLAIASAGFELGSKAQNILMPATTILASDLLKYSHEYVGPLDNHSITSKIIPYFISTFTAIYSLLYAPYPKGDALNKMLQNVNTCYTMFSIFTVTHQITSLVIHSLDPFFKTAEDFIYDHMLQFSSEPYLKTSGELILGE